MTSPLPPSLFTRSAGFTHFLILLLLLLLVPLDNSSQARRLLRHWMRRRVKSDDDSIHVPVALPSFLSLLFSSLFDRRRHRRRHLLVTYCRALNSMYTPPPPPLTRSKCAMLNALTMRWRWMKQLENTQSRLRWKAVARDSPVLLLLLLKPDSTGAAAAAAAEAADPFFFLLLYCVQSVCAAHYKKKWKDFAAVRPVKTLRKESARSLEPTLKSDQRSRRRGHTHTHTNALCKKHKKGNGIRRKTRRDETTSMSSWFLLLFYSERSSPSSLSSSCTGFHSFFLILFLVFSSFLLPPSSFVASYFYLLINHEKKWPRWDALHNTAERSTRYRFLALAACSLCYNCQWMAANWRRTRRWRWLCREEGRKATEKKAARLFVWVCVVVVVCSFSSTKAAKNVHSHITIRENPWRDVVVIATSLGRPVVVVVVVVYLILLFLSFAIFL